MIVVMLAIPALTALVSWALAGLPPGGMRLLIAIAHILGAVVVVAVLWLLMLFASAWMLERQRKQFLEKPALALGMTVQDLELRENTPWS